MRLLTLFVAALCTLAALWGFDGGALDAFSGAFAVLNFGMYVRDP